MTPESTVTTASMNQISNEDLKEIVCQTSSLFDQDFVKGSGLFITGATGFFGKWLLESFIRLNNELGLDSTIYALSRNPEKFLRQYPHFKHEKAIKWLEGDIRTFAFPPISVDYIIHAATDADAILNLKNPLLMLDTITEGTKRVLAFANGQKELKAFLFTSSGAVYGKQPENVAHVKETDSFYIDINNPESAYAEGKRLSELYCSVFARECAIPVKIARCFAFVGPHLPLEKHFAIGNFVHNVLFNQDIVIKGDGTPLRSYMYATDLIIWLITILLKGKVGYPYNVGSDQSISIRDLAILVNGYQTNKRDVIILGKNNGQLLEQYVPDTSRCRNELNLHVRVGLDESVQRTLTFYKQNS